MVSRSYQSQLSVEAARFVVSLRRRQQRVVLDIAEQIARQPFAIGDYRTEDLAGRPIENILVGDWLFTYWVDHALKEVRIIEISAI